MMSQAAQVDALMAEVGLAEPQVLIFDNKDAKSQVGTSQRQYAFEFSNEPATGSC